MRSRARCSFGACAVWVSSDAAPRRNDASRQILGGVRMRGSWAGAALTVLAGPCSPPATYGGHSGVGRDWATGPAPARLLCCEGTGVSEAGSHWLRKAESLPGPLRRLRDSDALRPKAPPPRRERAPEAPRSLPPRAPLPGWGWRSLGGNPANGFRDHRDYDWEVVVIGRAFEAQRPLGKMQILLWREMVTPSPPPHRCDLKRAKANSALWMSLPWRMRETHNSRYACLLLCASKCVYARTHVKRNGPLLQSSKGFVLLGFVSLGFFVQGHSRFGGCPLLDLAFCVNEWRWHFAYINGDENERECTIPMHFENSHL